MDVATAAKSGKERVKVVPAPSPELVTLKSPPCISAKRLASAKPQPGLARHLGSFYAREHSEDAIKLTRRHAETGIADPDQRALSLSFQLNTDPASIPRELGGVRRQVGHEDPRWGRRRRPDCRRRSLPPPIEPGS
jgi:hypothetical protein